MNRTERRKKAIELINREIKRETHNIGLTQAILNATEGYTGKAGKMLATKVQKALDELEPDRYECEYREPYHFSSELVIVDKHEYEVWRAESSQNTNGIWCEPDNVYGRWETRFSLKSGFDKGVPDWDREYFLKSNACHYTAAMARNKRRASDIVDGTLDKWLNAMEAVELAEKSLENTDKPESQNCLKRELFK